MTHYFKAMAGAVNMEGGKVKLVSRGDKLPAGLAAGEFDRLMDQGALATDAEWAAGESVPHHMRPPHRGSLDPRSEREPETNLHKVVVDLAPPAASGDTAVVGTEGEIMAATREAAGMDPADAGSADAENGSAALPDLNDLNDDALLGLYEGKPPLVSDLLTAVGDDSDLAARVLDVEQAGPNRSTLTSKLEGIIEDDGE
ncbi:MAG TPA: hypothetical protein VNJ54_21565 [Plantibacter sp.]|uniref:hypothetical protein n=1 Tax=Plantibacter sp. TaxID=1871045 RepID=UPI002C75E408|nr:hypothetical protein [Plantibacter sp.]